MASPSSDQFCSVSLGPAAEPDMANVRLMFETNLFGIMATVREFTPLVVATKGRIISVASVAGLVGFVYIV